MKDFWLFSYSLLLKKILKSGYNVQTYEEFIKNPLNKVVILRHDVDRKPQNALKMAKIEKQLQVRSSYYFRIVPESFNPKVINEIKQLGHEIGYHYENLTKVRGNYKKALEDFERNLEILREFYPIKTMCMHGSPTSKWDNRKLWERYDYKKYGIIAEPYFDLDFNKILYITDASRSWNNDKVTIRDKVKSNIKFSIKNINDIINEFNESKFPNIIMMNIHPNYWTNNKFEWLKILIWQNLKNIIKYFINYLK